MSKSILPGGLFSGRICYVFAACALIFFVFVMLLMGEMHGYYRGYKECTRVLDSIKHH